MGWAEMVSWVLSILQVFLLGVLAGFHFGHKNGWNACDSFQKRWADKE